MSDEHRSKDFTEKLIVGIDLGTTKSCMAVWRPDSGRVAIIRSAEGDTITQSVVAWDRENQQWIVGGEAREVAISRPTDVVYSIKRCIGREYKDKYVQEALRDLTYNLTPGDGMDLAKDVLVDFETRPDSPKPHQLSPSEISAKVLSKLRTDAIRALNSEVKYAIITVPAYFGVPQREATRLAGRLAELEVVAILNEPTAAALAYGVEYDDVITSQWQKLLVYDLGGGTFDISILDVKRQVDGFQVDTLGVDGDTRLGGDDIDIGVVHWLEDEIERRCHLPVPQDNYQIRALLRREAVQAKVELSKRLSTRIYLPQLNLGGKLVDVNLELTREQLERCADAVIQRTCEITQSALVKAGLKWEDIDQILLVGGQTQMPAIQHAVQQMTGKQPRKLDWPQEAVARGAGEYAHILSLGQKAIYEHALTHVTALPLGTRLDTNTFYPIVQANSRVPAIGKANVTTTQDNETEIIVHVLQKPREAITADDCTLLGSLQLRGIPPAPKGVPTFELAFNVKDDGTLKVTVTDIAGRLPERTIDIVESRTKTLMYIPQK